jgi:dTMP kinase
MNASRAQLVREIIRPALAAGEIVLCDRFCDSTVAYQGYGRGLDLKRVESVIDLAVGNTRPDLTVLLHVPVAVSESRRKGRDAAANPIRDRFEESNREFFEKVERGFLAIAKADSRRVKVIDATGPIEDVSSDIWKRVDALLGDKNIQAGVRGKSGD